MTKYFIKNRANYTFKAKICPICGEEMVKDEFYALVTDNVRYKCEYCGGTD
jgi:aspartate carbamoyltransferase regulatory subunit